MEFFPKCVIVGSAGVGKSSILSALDPKRTEEDRVATIMSKSGAILDVEIFEFNDKTISEGDNPNVLLRGDAYMFVYSVDQPKSFEFIRNIMNSLKKRQKKRKIRFIVVANKVDLEDQRAVTKEDGLNLTEHFRGSLYIETCALQSASDVFTRVADFLNSSTYLQTDIGCNCTLQ